MQSSSCLYRGPLHQPGVRFGCPLPQEHIPVANRPLRGHLQVSCAIKKGAEKNIVCSKTLVGKPGKEKQLKQRCRDIVDFSKGRMAVRSSGVLAFECLQDRYEENVFHFWERYESNPSMGRHNNSAEMQAFMTKARVPVHDLPELRISGDFPRSLLANVFRNVQIQDLIEGPVGMALYEWKDGKIGQQCIQGGMHPSSI